MRLLVEVLEPNHGRVLDPACGSGGMFVQSARFVAEHKKNPASELSIHGQEKERETANLRRTLDLLLPRLLSGALELSGLEEPTALR